MQARGVATGFQTLGLTIGNLISVAGLFTVTERIMHNKLYSFSVLAILQVFFAIGMFFMITEPNIMDDREERRHKKKSFWGKLFSMLKLAMKACKEDKALLIALIALNSSRNTAQL